MMFFSPRSTKFFQNKVKISILATDPLLQISMFFLVRLSNPSSSEQYTISDS